ncbi:MAG: type II toxin-antitoxin system HicB family antitoxin [Nanoarchaeota archaeon]
MEIFNVLIEKDDDGYFISDVVELPGCHTQAKSMDSLIERTKEAIILYLKCAEPKEIHMKEKFIGLQQIEV